MKLLFLLFCVVVSESIFANKPPVRHLQTKESFLVWPDHVRDASMGGASERTQGPDMDIILCYLLQEAEYPCVFPVEAEQRAFFWGSPSKNVAGLRKQRIRYWIQGKYLHDKEKFRIYLQWNNPLAPEKRIETFGIANRNQYWPAIIDAILNFDSALQYEKTPFLSRRARRRLNRLKKIRYPTWEVFMEHVELSTLSAFLAKEQKKFLKKSIRKYRKFLPAILNLGYSELIPERSRRQKKSRQFLKRLSKLRAKKVISSLNYLSVIHRALEHLDRFHPETQKMKKRLKKQEKRMLRRVSFASEMLNPQWPSPYANVNLWRKPISEEELPRLIERLKRLESDGFENTMQYIATGIHLASLLPPQNKRGVLKAVADRCNLLMLERNILCGSVYYYLADDVMLSSKQRKYYLKKAKKNFKRNGIYRKVRKKMKRKKWLSLNRVLNIPVPYKDSMGLTPLESHLLASYTAAFNIKRHSMRIRARTYAGRQDDTNEFLRDLISQKIHIPGFSTKDITFLDIGPAVGNLKTPAVTSVSIARQFPSLTVIALDLPEQIERFQKEVDAKVRAEVLAIPNFYLMRGDGRFPLVPQMRSQENWMKAPRGFKVGRGSWMIRAVNSVDIYLNWYTNQRTLAAAAKSLQDTPLLIQFNRSLLLKTKRSKQFKLIGIFSVRGFHHNRRLFTRDGDAPYLIPEPLSKILGEYSGNSSL